MEKNKLLQLTNQIYAAIDTSLEKGSIRELIEIKVDKLADYIEKQSMTKEEAIENVAKISETIFINESHIINDKVPTKQELINLLTDNTNKLLGRVMDGTSLVVDRFTIEINPIAKTISYHLKLSSFSYEKL